jgi:hypothetical protein
MRLPRTDTSHRADRSHAPVPGSAGSGAMVRSIRSMLGMPTERDEAKPQWTWNRSTRFARSGGSVRSTFPVRLT